MPSQHALLSPSSSSRWINCPASLRLEEALPDKPSSSYAEEGTRAHALAEQKLLKYLNPEFVITTKPDDEDMEEYTHKYVEYVLEQFNDVQSKTPDAILKIETRLSFSRWLPDSFGTADALIIGDGTIHVIDLKYGRGVEVSAHQNTQLLIYAAGAYDLFSTLFDIDEVVVHIVQPRLGNISSQSYSVDELLDGMQRIEQQAKKALAGEQEFSCGEWCRWCKLNPTCKKKKEWIESQKLALDAVMMTDDEIADLLPKLDTIASWVKEIKEYATQKALEGHKYNGFKIVEGRTSRKVTEPDKLIGVLTQEGFKEDDLYKPKEVLGISGLEKLVGKKKLTELAGEFIKKPQGQPTLVPVTDRRPEYNPAVNDFADEFGG